MLVSLKKFESKKDSKLNLFNEKRHYVCFYWCIHHGVKKATLRCEVLIHIYAGTGHCFNISYLYDIFCLMQHPKSVDSQGSMVAWQKQTMILSGSKFIVHCSLILFL